MNNYFIVEEVAEPDLQILEDPDPFSGASFHSDSGPVHSTPAPAAPSLTEEQHRRMELNRQRALERRLARQQQQTGERHCISCVMKNNFFFWLCVDYLSLGNTKTK